MQEVIVLCTTQQLAVDLAIRQPPEGLEVRLDWIKNLVSHVVFNKDSRGEDQSAEMVAKVNAFMNTVMDSVKQAIEATKERLKKEHGRAVPSAAMMICSSLGTSSSPLVRCRTSNGCYDRNGSQLNQRIRV